MLVSIIIPCYNNEAFIEEAINSALNQSHKSCEVIVVDDGSTDSSNAIIERFSEAVLALRQENAGACAARNHGLSRASGDLVKFLDGDDILETDCVRQQVASMADRDVVVFGDYFFLFDDGGKSRGKTHQSISGLKKGDSATLATFLESPVLISTTLYRRSDLADIGGFDTTVLRFQEIDLHLRLYLNGVKFEYHPSTCFQYRIHFSPSRISIAKKQDAFYWDFKRFKVLVSDVQFGAQAEDWSRSRLVLGKLAWRVGRKKVRQNLVADAKKFFRLARELGGGAVLQGRSSYKILVRLLGPVWAERISMLRQRSQKLMPHKDIRL